MIMSGNVPPKVKGIPQLLQLRGLPKSKHPLIAVFDIAAIKELPRHVETPLTTDFYFIGMKKFLPCVIKMTYGQQEHDFDEGQMRFIAPGQVFSFNATPIEEINQSGWLLLVHPDFLWNSPLARKIKQYEFFDYSVNEALFLSEQEEFTMNNLF